MKRLFWLAPLLLILMALVAFAALPLWVVAARALGALVEVLPVAENREALINSVSIALLTTALASLLGAPLAFALARLALPGQARLKTLMILPAVVPPYLWAIAWIDLTNPKTGLLNLAAAGIGLPSPLFDCYSIGGIVGVLGLSFYPFVLLPVHAALEQMDASLEESARLSGASPLRVLREITLPLVTPAWTQGAVMVFLAALAAFGVPYLLGTAGTHRIPVLTTRIVNHITLGGEQQTSRAMALALVLLAVSSLAAWLGGRAASGERRFAIVSGKGARPRPLRLSATVTRAITAGLWLLLAIGVILPLCTLLLVSLIRAWGAGFSPANWSLDSYQRVLFQNHDTVPALLRSVTLGAAAATLAVLAGAWVAYARARRSNLLTRALELLANTPYAVPGTVLALGLLIAWSRELRVILFERLTLSLDLFAGAWALLVAYAVKYLAFGVRSTKSALSQLDPSLEEAARTSGAGPTRAAIDVVAPLIAPALAAAWLLVFLPALSEITMSVLLAGPGTQVVGTVLFELQSYADPPSAAVLACLLVAMTLLGNALLRRASQGRSGF